MLLCLLVAVLGTSILIHISNIPWLTTWQHALGNNRQRI